MFYWNSIVSASKNWCLYDDYLLFLLGIPLMSADQKSSLMKTDSTEGCCLITIIRNNSKQIRQAKKPGTQDTWSGRNSSCRMRVWTPSEKYNLQICSWAFCRTPGSTGDCSSLQDWGCSQGLKMCSCSDLCYSPCGFLTIMLWWPDMPR